MNARLLKIAGLAIAIGVFGPVVCVSLHAQPGAKSIPVPVDQVPKRVVAAVKKRFPQGKIVEAEHSAPRPLDEGGSMGLTVTDGKKEIHVAINCVNGADQIETIWWEIAPGEVPGFVMEPVRSKHPHATVSSAREIHDELRTGDHQPPEPPSYCLRIKTGNDEELDVWLVPEVKATGDGVVP